jgi:hypothetical protein
MSESTKIVTALKKFDYGSLNKTVYGKAHDTIIGEWVKWWICETAKRGHIHCVVNPAIQASYWGKTYCADLLLAEHIQSKDKSLDEDDGEKREFVRVVGVAEIENDRSEKKIKHRINSLEAYEKSRDRTRRKKFPDLRFGILSTFAYPEEKEEIEFALSYMREKSLNSKMLWILYVLSKKEVDEHKEFFFKVSGCAIDKSRLSFYYCKTFCGTPKWFVFRKGRLMRV